MVVSLYKFVYNYLHAKFAPYLTLYAAYKTLNISQCIFTKFFLNASKKGNKFMHCLKEKLCTNILFITSEYKMHDIFIKSFFIKNYFIKKR